MKCQLRYRLVVNVYRYVPDLLGTLLSGSKDDSETVQGRLASPQHSNWIFYLAEKAPNY